MRFKDYFSNDFETGENHYIKTLQTRYYRCRYEQAKEAVLKAVEQEKGRVKAMIEQHHEVFFQCPAYTSTITIIQTRIGEIAIDIKVTTYKVLPMGAGKKIIERLYHILDSMLPFKGVSLYKE